MVEFTCTWSSTFEALEYADEANKEKAIAFVNRFKLNPKGATAMGPCMVWALEHYDSDTFILVTDGDPNVLKSGSGRVGWREHAGMIAEANSRGATIHIIAVSPTTEAMHEFNKTVAAQNGPGRIRIVGLDAAPEPQPTEGLEEEAG